MAKKISPAERLAQLRKFDMVMILQSAQTGILPARIIGVDECGIGPVAGPVVAAALILDSFDGLEGVDDCKVLSDEQRREAYEAILPRIQEVQFVSIAPVIIDEMNVARAAQYARETAVSNLRSARSVDIVIVDGNQPNGVQPEGPQDSRAVVKADTKSLTVAAASILAKVHRDTMMADLGRAYPEYGFAQNKGYPTPDHLAALQEYGVSPYHRRSFRPVSDVLSGKTVVERAVDVVKALGKPRGVRK